MKRLLVVLLSFLLIPVPNVSAATNTEMSDEELAEYFIFEEDTWWDYVNYVDFASDYDTSDITFVDDVEDATTRTESISCRIFRCFTLSSGQVYIDYYIENGNIYMDTYDGYDTDDLLVFSLDGIDEDQVDEVWGYLLGFESLSGYEASLQCGVDLGTYDYDGHELDSLQSTCTTFLKGVDDIEYRVVSVEYYLKGLGKVSTETKLYQDGEWQITYNVVLTNTSIELEDDGKEVIDTVVDEEEVNLAGDEDLSDQNIEDYFEFEDSTWWEYETTTTNYIDDSSATTRTVERNSDSDGLDGYLEDNVYYLSSFNGEDFEEPYVGFDLDGYSQSIRDEDYDAFGIDEDIWGEVDDMTVVCEYSLDDTMKVEMDNGEEYEDVAIFEECTLEFKLVESGAVMEMIVESSYIKNLGMVSSIARFYANNAVILQGSIELISTSLLEEATFTDVDADHDNYTAIEYLHAENVIAGYDDGSFKPDDTVNRAELLKILVEGQGMTPNEETYKNCFPDVTTDWYAKYVCYAKEQGWVSGYDDGFFRPADPVNKVEALKMLLNSQDVEIHVGDQSSFEDFSEGEWFAPYVAKAEGLGILEENGASFHPDNDRTRAGIAEELYRLLTL